MHWWLEFSLLAPGLCSPASGWQDPADAATQAQSPSVIVVELEGQLRQSWASILRRAQERVTAQAAAGFILELDTPGGEEQLMKQLGDQLVAIGETTDTVVYVTRQAKSAGVYLAMGGQQIWMAPGSAMGSSAPIAVGPGGIPIMQPDQDVQEKMMSSIRADFRSWAELRDRNPAIAEAFVDNDVELRRITLFGEERIVSDREFNDLIERGENPDPGITLTRRGELLALTPNEAIDLEYCEGIAADREDLLRQLGWDSFPLITMQPTWSEGLADTLGNYSWLLLLGFLFCLVVAFNMPGLGAPELVAVAFLGIFLLQNYIIGLAEMTEILLVVGGILLILAEIFIIPGTMFAGIAGAVLVLAGLILAMQPFVLPEGGIEMRLFRHNLMVLLIMLATAPFLSYFAVRKFAESTMGRRWIVSPSGDLTGPVSSNSAVGASGEREDLELVPGEMALTRSPLRPAGTIEVRGVRLDAISTGGFLAADEQVRVVRRQGASWLVEPFLPPNEGSERPPQQI